MPRPVLLFTGPFADLPLAELAAKAAEWGYAGLELCTWGDHLEVQRAAGDPDYCADRAALLASHDLQAPVVSAHRVGQAVCDLIDERHRPLVPDYVWGNGNPEGVRERAAAELVATVRVAQQLGAATVSASVEATYDLRPPRALLVLYLLPFVLAGLLWGRLLIRRRSSKLP